MKDYEAIVIGAGNGGLTSAVTLQQKGIKTLLLERHNIPGGCATSFVRGDFEFEVALHQLSGMGTEKKPAIMRQIFTKLGVMGKVEFIEEGELYRMIVPGEIDITLPADMDSISSALKQNFPKQSVSIDKFIALCQSLTIENVMILPKIQKSNDQEELRKNCPNFVKYGLKSTNLVLDEFFDDKKIKAVLGAYWGYLGLPLKELPFSDLALLFYTYAEFKPYHIKGGSQALSNALLDTFLEAGGEVRFNCAAEKIQTRDGRVSSVLTEHGNVLSCNTVISNSSSIHTYNELLDIGQSGDIVREDFKSRRLGISGFVIYLGLDCTPEQLDITTATNFINTTLDDDEVFQRARTLDDPLGAVFTCYNFDDPSFAPKGKTHAALMCLQYGEAWDDVKPEDYTRTKYAFAEKLLDLAETGFPGIRKHIEEVEVATPMTMMRYLNTPGGAIYGFDQSVTNSPLFRERHDVVDGLYLAGAWSGMGGFQPTYQAGVKAANSIIKQKNTIENKEATHD